MNFDWVKAPKTAEEEKEQFDKLYHLLVKLSKKDESVAVGQQEPLEKKGDSTGGAGTGGTGGTGGAVGTEETIGPLDEFTAIKMDIIASLYSGGTNITIIQTCRGCEVSFYSEMELMRHQEASPACQEWIRCCPATNPKNTKTPLPPFFTFLEKGLATLLTPEGTDCTFCHKSLPSRKAQEKHYTQSLPCNRLAHYTLRKWMGSPE
jgi:hypothetical protein